MKITLQDATQITMDNNGNEIRIKETIVIESYNNADMRSVAQRIVHILEKPEIPVKHVKVS